MCGICGKVDFTPQLVDKRLIQEMCGTLIHRGPDGEGVYTAEHIGLGQRRLAIIDLNSRAVAPLSNEDESVWVTFNGEIYNYQQIRSRLIAQGHTFRTETDTEVLVHLYEEEGFNCVHQLRGMFAFAIWDARKKLLFAARDRLGKKPFYYARTSSSLVFGSEIKALLTDQEISSVPNYQAIDRFLKYSYVPSPLTAFEGIYKLPPAHTLLCSSNGSITIERYWTPPSEEKIFIKREELRAEILRQLSEAVAIRLNSDVPLGVFLSGGIDSATVVALIAQQASRSIKTFSIGFEDEAYNELPYARLVAKQYGTDHHELIVQPVDDDVIWRLVRSYNEPFADSSAVPTFFLSEFTRKHVTVALSGDGGDELFCGYHRYGSVQKWGSFDFVPQAVRAGMVSPIRLVMNALPYGNRMARYGRGLFMLSESLPRRYDLEMSVTKPEERKQLYSRKFRHHLEEQENATWSLAHLTWQKSMDGLDWMMRNDQNFYLPDCLMTKVDVASMANSLEVRCPFVDHKLMEFMSRIPSSMKRSGQEGKIILKEAVGSLLPPATLRKTKTGFGLPVSSWLGQGLKPLMRSMLLDDIACRRGIFEPHFVRAMVDEHLDCKRDWGYRLWSLLMLEMWFREFID